MSLDLPLVFAVLMGASILAYVVLDGYDLGVGMLLPAADRDEQDRMVASIGPFWDANGTWLVLGVGLLLVAFPGAHGEVLGALYLPVAAMLVGLMLRGAAFELRIKAEGWHRELWNWLFALVTGAALCGGYVLLGATWLIYRVEGALRDKAVAWARWGLLWVALGFALVSLGTPLVSETVREKWFSVPRIFFLAALPAATVAAWCFVWFNLRRSDTRPFLGAVAIYVLAFAGLAYSLFPYVIIDRMTIWQAAAHDSALKFVLAGAAVVLPFIVGYTLYVYRLFGGKAKDGAY